MTEEPLSIARVANLKAAFTKSDLPYRVDVVDWASTSESFREVIEKDYVVLAEREDWDRSDEWTECTLADACSSIDYGLTASASKNETGLRFLRITDIVSGYIDWQKVPHVVVDDELVSKYQLYDGDIVVARTGASTGTSIYVKNPPLALFASYLVRLQAKPDYDARFLAYFLKSNEFWGFIRGVLGDKSAQPNASASTMTAAPLKAPKNKNEQRVIAHILGTLDDKIELNRRMNETLEAMARALFKSWFVDFDPVRAKMEGRDSGLPRRIADLFPDQLMDSAYGEIPEGWEVKTLGDLCHKSEYGYTASAKDEPVGPKFLRITDINKRAWIDWGDVPYCEIDEKQLNKYRLHKGDVLIARMADPGHGVMVEDDQEAVFASYLIRFRSKNAFNSRLLQYWLKSDNYWELVTSRGAGTTRVSLNAKVLNEFPLITPPDSVAKEFSDLTDSIRHRLVANVADSRTLATLRDALLPKLVSGEFRVEREK